ncbi:vitamin B6 photo-protection and homoeostasis-domain-containing protein [Fimicolochytrium jonesii]|uniref:vitamin B6 photo-protection and homoeostasis-domain-containing protein n=1 Tax=Fimicolochytrium jonesii TaxID=1396493 RepID=UPI0022FDF087|nr:vitamin B6 photo-protection and homoeostasis-domain-containing protein [Fimicolochytrium jonesii]KAI8824199.1 vitamin B6 photo-protection and homoeostasis-domain-containing protein [Fimicolochytrium jonesii]
MASGAPGQKAFVRLSWNWVVDSAGPKSAVDRLLDIVPSFGGWLRAMFLPVGYPASVHPVYAKVHIYQFLETFVWSAVSVLCSQAMLASIGIGSTAAAAGTAVAVQWVLKDGIGEIGKLFFIQRFARSFDSHPKTWKFVGEVSSLTGAFMQLCTVVSPSSWFLPLASAGYALRSIHYSIWGATHMTFTRNFALQGNVGDLVAKDDSQMSVAHLAGMLWGVGAITISHSPAYLFTGFLLLTPIHFFMTLSLLRAAQFEVLNHTNLTLICRQYVADQTIPGMNDLKRHERWFGEWLAKGEQVVRIDVGATANKAFDDASVLSTAIRVLKTENYLLSTPNSPNEPVHICLHTSAAAHDVIKAMLHATRFHHELAGSPTKVAKNCALTPLESSHQWTLNHFPRFIAELDERDWQSDAVFWGDGGRRVEWKRGEGK